MGLNQRSLVVLYVEIRRNRHSCPYDILVAPKQTMRNLKTGHCHEFSQKEKFYLDL